MRYLGQEVCLPWPDCSERRPSIPQRSHTLTIASRWSFNITLFLAGVFGLAAGGAPNFITLASLLAVLGLGVGGNLPVDSAVFLDFVPGTHQYLLTVLSIWWSIGQLVADLVRTVYHHTAS